MNKNLSKNYLKIGQAAKTIGVSIDTLRRWEKSGKITTIRTPGGTRLYHLSTLKKINPSSVLDFQAKSFTTEELLKKAGAGSQDHPFVTLSETKGIYSSPSAQNDKEWAQNDNESPRNDRLKKSLITRFLIGSAVLSVITLLITSWITTSYLTNPKQTQDFFKNNVASGILSPFHLLAEEAVMVINPNKAKELDFSHKLAHLEGEKMQLHLPGESGVLAVTASPKYLEVNADTQINGSLFVRDAINGLSLEATASAGTIALNAGTTTLTITKDALLDQDVSTTSTPSFTSANLSGTSNQLVFQSGGPSGTLTWTPTAARVITLPNVTTTLVGTDNSQTLTNKSLSGSSNTFTSIPNSALSNSKVTVTAGTNMSGGGDVNLGSSATLSLTGSPAISGVLTLADGTAAAPALTFTNDTNTGLYRIGTDKIGLITGGTATYGVTVDSSGYVGIGTISPGAALEIAGQVKITGGTPGLNKVLTSDAAGLASWVAIGTAGGITGTGTSGYITKFTGISTVAVSNLYDDGTNIGIGTATPNDFKLEVAGNIGPEADNTRNIGSTDRYYANVYAKNLITGTSGTVGYWTRASTTLSPVTAGDSVSLTGSYSTTPATDATALTLTGTNVATSNLAYFNAKNTSGTIFNIAYGAAATLTGDLVGTSIDLNDGKVVDSTHSITGFYTKLPTITATNDTGTVSLKGLSVFFGTGSGINETGAGALIYTAADLSMPALTQTAGTLTANGVLITTPASITTGGTANGVNISPTGVGAGTLNGINIGTIATPLSGTETAMAVGTGWDNVLKVGSTAIINGSGVVQVAGGGTGIASYTAGDLIYASDITTFTKLAGGTGNNGKVLVVASGVPSWGSVTGAFCTDCLINDPSSTQILGPTGSNTTGLTIRQTSTALGGNTPDIFSVASSDGLTKYFSIDYQGNVSTGAIANTTLTLTPTTDTTALTLVGTNVLTANLQYINSKNLQGTILNIAYGAAATLNNNQTLTGQNIDLSTNVTANASSTNTISVTGTSITLPAPTNTNTSGTNALKGLVITAGSGINQNGAGGTTTFSGADITIPPLTQSAGTLTANGVLVTTPSSITTGGTANGVNIAASGVGAGTLNGLNISGITASTGTETAINVGSGWDYAAIFAGGNVGIGTTAPAGNLDVTNATIANAGKLVNLAGTLTTSTSSGTGYGLYNAITNANTTNADSAYATYTSLTDAVALGNTNYGLYTTVANTGAIDSAITKTIYGSYVSASGTGGAPTTAGTTAVYGEYLTTTATHAGDFGTVNQYGLYIANGTSSTNGTSTKTGLYVESPTGADNNYAAIFAGGNVGIGTTAPEVKLEVSGDTKTSGGTHYITGSVDSNDQLRFYVSSNAPELDFYVNSARAAVFGHDAGVGRTIMYNDAVGAGGIYIFNTGGVAIGTDTATLAGNAFIVDQANSKIYTKSGINIGIGDATPDALLDIDSTDTNGGDFLITNTGIGLSGTVAGITSNSTTTGDIFTISGTALTTGSLAVLTGPSGGTAGVTDAALKITSDVGNIGTSNGLISSTATFDGTTATGINLYLSSTDAVVSGNTDYGLYNAVSNTGAIDSAITKTIYGSYISASGTGGAPTTAGTTAVYGEYLTTTATHAGDFGTVNQYGLYIANGTSSTNGTSTKTGLYVESPTGADTNYAAIFAGGNVGIGTTAPAFGLDMQKTDAANPNYAMIRLTNSVSATATKVGGLLGVSYAGANVDYLIYQSDNSGGNLLYVGGGFSAYDAATRITFTTDEAVGGGIGHTRLTIDNNGNVVMGSAALATDATDGFFYLDTSAGAPTGVPTAYTGRVATEYDTTNNQLCVYNGGWKCHGAFADIAEWMPARGAEIGDLVSVTDEPNPIDDPTAPFMLGKSTQAYDSKLVGIISEYREGANMAEGYKKSEDYHAVALAGRVPVKVSTENGPIEKGDFLTSSSTPGIAMKATRAGQMIGKALENFTDGNTSEVCRRRNTTSEVEEEVPCGKILAFVNPSFADPGDFLASLTLDENGNLVMPAVKVQKLTLDAGLNLDTEQLNKNLAYQTNVLGTGDISYSLDVKGSLENLAVSISTQSAQLANVSSEVASTSATLSAAIASQSATLAETKTHTQELAEQLASASAQLAQTKSEVDELKLTPPDILLATGSAKLANLKITSEATVSGMLVAYQAEIQDNFKSLGQTTLGKTLIAGDLTVDGTMSINGNSLNTLGILYVQNSSLAGNVDLFNGKVIINSAGNIVSLGEVAAASVVINKLTISNTPVASSSASIVPTIGSEKIIAGQTSVTINTAAISSSSKIFVTPRTKIGNQALVVDSVTIGTGFTVSLDHAISQDTDFDWWVVETK